MSDPEIEAMGQVAAAIDNLADDARGRVLRWAVDRYGAQVAMATPVRTSVGALDGSRTTNRHVTLRPRRVGASFEHFVDLFDAVDPKTDVDKALTGAYWLQVMSQQDSWQALR